MTATDRPAATERPASEPRFESAVEWDVRIRARDGVELSANIWRPRTDERIPAILEMIPYGKDNWRRSADMTRGAWFAERGYALCRVDVRGTGSSFGVALDEYTADETRDGFVRAGGSTRNVAAETLRMTAWDADPARAELDAHVVYRWQESEPARNGELTRIQIRADSRQTSTVTDFDLTVSLEVDVDGERFFERTWHEVIPRHLV